MRSLRVGRGLVVPDAVAAVEALLGSGAPEARELDRVTPSIVGTGMLGQALPDGGRAHGTH